MRTSRSAGRRARRGAEPTLLRVSGGLLILMVGAPGSGKSTLARRLAAELGAELVNTDRVRKQLFPEPRYTGGESAAVYGWCHTLVRTLLEAGRRVVFDATNLQEHGRRRFYETAERAGARLVAVWAACPPRVIQERLLRRASDPDEDDLSDADWLVYLQLRLHAEPLRRPHLVVNTTTDHEPLVRRIASAAGLPPATARRAG